MLDAVLAVILIAAKAFLTIVVVIFLIVGCLISYLSMSLQKRGRPLPANRKHWKRALLGKGFGLDELVRRLDVSGEELRGFSPDYTERFIEKRKREMRFST